MSRARQAACALLLIPGWLLGQESVELRLRANYTEAVVLRPDAPQVERPFAMDATERVEISVLATSTTLEVTLIDPSGGLHQAGATDSIVTASYLGTGASDTVPGQSYEFELSNPAAGMWKYRVRETEGFTGVRAAIFVLTSSSDLVAALLGMGLDYPANRPMALGLVVADRQSGIPPSSVTSLTANIQIEGQPPIPITFRDDGKDNDIKANDGAYSATFTVVTPGTYSIAASVSGNRNGQAFMRTAAGQFTVVRTCGSLARGIQSRPLDTDGNGRPDVLETIFNVNVTQPGKFHLAVTLAASNGKKTSFGAFADLAAGSQAAPVRIPLTHLRSLGVNGPYQISEVRLECYDGSELRTTDRQTDLGSTALFDLSKAERNAIELSGANTERPVDTNGNGLYERLDFSVGLDLLAAGDFQWSGSLFDSKGAEIDFASGTGPLALGKSTAVLQFNGTKIAKNAADGPYLVRNFLIFGSAASAVLLNVGQTQAYLYDKFEGAFARPAGPRVNQGGVVNAASFQPALARGSIASLFGISLAAATVVSSQVPLPTTLSGVRVTVGGVNAPLFFVSPTQINFQVPFEAPVQDGVPIVVIRDGNASSPVGVTIAEYAPGIFTYERAPGVRDPIALHLNGQMVTPDNPAVASEVLILYATGVGGLDNPPTTGAASLASPLAKARLTPSITIGGAAVDSMFAGLAPNFVGLAQFNIRLPAALPAGQSLPLLIRFGPVSGQSVNLAVRSSQSGSLDVAVKLNDVFPKTVVEGDNLTFDFTVRNPFSVKGDVTRSLYLSTLPATDPSFSLSKARLVNAGAVTLAGADLTSRSWSNALPAGLAPGVYYVFVTVTLPGDNDPSNDVSNAMAITFIVQRPPFDLRVDMGTVSPASVGPGDPIQVTYTVTGLNRLSGTFDRSLYLSAGNAVTTSSTLINSRRLDLVDGSADVTSAGNCIPRDTAPGNYFVGMVVQTAGDSNPSNNSSVGRPIAVTAQRAPFNLGVTASTVTPSRTAPGQSFNLTYKIKNLSKSTGIYYRTIYLSTDQTISTSKTLINTRTVELAGGGDSEVTSENNVVPAGLPPGNYFVGVILESVGDTSPADNISNPMPLTVTGVSQP